MWQAWINAILGLWLIVASFTIAGSKAANLANGLIAGIILLVLGLWAAVSYKGWQSLVVAVIGAWVIVAGLWFPSSYVATVANDIIAGVVVAIAGIWAGFSRAFRPKEA
jgi:membrane-bound ClpP family serine protease